MIRRWLGLWLAVMVALLPVLAVADDNTPPSVRVARYSTLAAVPTEAQRDPLQKLIQIEFPAEIYTVGDALRHVLRDSGYRLASAYASDPAMGSLLAKRLPEVHRKLGPVNLETALTALAGPVFRLVIDPVHRLLSFEIVEKYRALLNASQSGSANPFRSLATKHRDITHGSNDIDQRGMHPCSTSTSTYSCW